VAAAVGPGAARMRCTPTGPTTTRSTAKPYDTKGSGPTSPRRGQPHGSGLGVVRWVVERTIAWYHGMKRLRIRWERRDDIHEAFLALATCIITYRHVKRLC
jgi:hypothetical protein